MNDPSEKRFSTIIIKYHGVNCAMNYQEADEEQAVRAISSFFQVNWKKDQ